MKVIVKNNRLMLDHRLSSLAECSDNKLKDIANGYGISLFKITRKPVEVHDQSIKTTMQEKELHEKKPRKVLEEEIRKRLTMTLDIPKEYWTEEQQYAWDSNNTEKLMDIAEFNRVKLDAGILNLIPPFEEGLGQVQTAKLLVEMTEDQFEYFVEKKNFRIEIEKDEETGQKRYKRKHVAKIMAHEWIPETDADLDRLQELYKKKKSVALKTAVEKYCKTEKPKVVDKKN